MFVTCRTAISPSVPGTQARGLAQPDPAQVATQPEPHADTAQHRQQDREPGR